MNRWWYSEKQKQITNYLKETIGMKNTYCEVYTDFMWQPFTEWTTSPNGKCNWDDAILVAVSDRELPIRVDGVLQGYGL